MVFEEGAVCVGISHTGANLNAAFGVPTAVVGQPSHVAYLTYAQTDKYAAAGNCGGKWLIGNDIAGWGESESEDRLLAGWGERNRVSDYKETNVSYVLLAQANLNHYQRYQQARLIKMAAETFKSDHAKREQTQEQILAVSSLDYDGWRGLIQAYLKNKAKTEADFVSLAERIKQALQDYPLPMIDLLKMLDGKIPSYKYLELKKLA